MLVYSDVSIPYRRNESSNANLYFYDLLVVSIPYRRNERLRRSVVGFVHYAFQFLIGAMKGRIGQEAGYIKIRFNSL